MIIRRRRCSPVEPRPRASRCDSSHDRRHTFDSWRLSDDSQCLQHSTRHCSESYTIVLRHHVTHTHTACRINQPLERSLYLFSSARQRTSSFEFCKRVCFANRETQFCGDSSQIDSGWNHTTSWSWMLSANPDVDNWAYANYMLWVWTKLLGIFQQLNSIWLL